MQRTLVHSSILITALLLVLSKACAGESATVQAEETHLSHITQLTNQGDNGEAYFSSDGQQLIYQSSRGGQQCDKIWTMDINGDNKQRVSPDHGAHTCSFFYPSNDEIVFASTSHLGEDCPVRPEPPEGVRYVWPLFPYSIYKANADGSNLQRLTDNPQYDAEPIISADGKKIVFGSQREGDFDIYIMDADGANVKRLTDTVGYDGGPWFSPDGSKIAWRSWYPETDKEKAMWKNSMENNFIYATPLDIWVMNSDGTGKQRLTDNGATNWAPSWHPDGKRLVFSSNKDDWREEHQSFGYNFELYLMDIDSGATERLTFNNVFDSFPMFSPDATKLVFGSNRNPDKPRATDVYIADWAE